MDENPGNRGPGIIAITAVLEALLLVFMALRVYTRVWIAKAFWWDDFTILLAALGTSIGAALCFLNVHHGFGTRVTYLSPKDILVFRKYTFAEWIQTFATLMWTKISICLFLIRMHETRKYRKLMYWVVGFLLLSNVILTVMWIMQCQPAHVVWTAGGRGLGCMDERGKDSIILSQAVISIVSDFGFASIPVLLLWRLQIELKTKIGLWVLMCLGFITGACAIVRTAMNEQALPEDETYGGVVNWVWRTFEVQIGIIAACMPTLRPLWGKIRGQNIHKGLGGGDSNVRFLNFGKGQSCLEDNPGSTPGKRTPGKATPASTPRDGNAMPRLKKHSLKLGKVDDVEQQLIEEGIVRPDGPRGMSLLPVLEKVVSEPELEQELNRFGITNERLSDVPF